MSSTITGAAHAPPPQADPELAKARRQLADWVSCPSRKTPAGQAKIQKYATEVSELTARDKNAQLQASRQAQGASDAAQAAAGDTSASPVTPTASGTRSGASLSPLGSIIDCHA